MTDKYYYQSFEPTAAPALPPDPACYAGVVRIHRAGEATMTVEERFERIEQITAGLAEERSKDREEYKTLWRDTERQIRELAIHIDEVDARLGNRIEQLGGIVDQFAAESRAAAADARAADARLGERIDALVSAIGQLLPEGKK
jgi:hypothetical protein